MTKTLSFVDYHGKKVFAVDGVPFAVDGPFSAAALAHFIETLFLIDVTIFVLATSESQKIYLVPKSKAPNYSLN